MDEAHHVKAESYRTILKAYPNAKVLGVTATPCRLNGAGFRDIFQDLILSDSVAKFISNGYLSNYDYYSIPPDSIVQKQIEGINEFDINGDYKERAMMRVLDTDKLRARIVDTYLKYAKNKKGIIYTINQLHNENVCKQFQERGITAKAIDSKTSAETRKEIVNDFRNGKFQILCNVNIFSEGFDCPDLEFVQLARPTKSLSLFLQQIGRGLRIAEGKEKVIFLDNVGLYNRFGLPSANRKWRMHFEGQEVTEAELKGNKSFEQDRIRFMDDIEEGDENVELIQSTLEVGEDFKHLSVDILQREKEKISIEISVFKKYNAQVPQRLHEKIEELDALLKEKIAEDRISQTPEITTTLYDDSFSETLNDIVAENIAFTTNYAIITENDESNYDDKTGLLYHFPQRYLKYLQPGTKVIYYKGKCRTNILGNRLSKLPHYFGVATIGDSYRDIESIKKYYYCEIKNYRPFLFPISIKKDDDYLEKVVFSNHFRDGVRKITEDVYRTILDLAVEEQGE